jgi:hypothetical protein
MIPVAFLGLSNELSLLPPAIILPTSWIVTVHVYISAPDVSLILVLVGSPGARLPTIVYVLSRFTVVELWIF